jgi:cytochrome P450
MAAAGPPADLVSDFALPIPSLVICELLGVPYSDRADFQRRSRTLLSLRADPADIIRAADDLEDYMRDLVRRKRADPTDDLLGALANPEDPADELTEAELVTLGNLLLIAGHETTANMIGLSTYLLLQRPAAWAALVVSAQESPDGALTDSAVEELLRYLSIVQFGVNRRATEDVEIGGVTIRAGEVVYGATLAANWDPGRFDHPDLLALDRGGPAHLAFGHGVHQCLGQQLARIELTVVFTELPRRFPELRLAVPADAVPMRDDMLIYGVHELPVTWPAAGS